MTRSFRIGDRGPIVANQAGKLPEEFVRHLVEWRQLVDVDRFRMLSGDESHHWRMTLAPLRDSLYDGSSTGREYGPRLTSSTFESYRRAGPLVEDTETWMKHLWAHPDSRFSEVLVGLTTPPLAGRRGQPKVIPVHLAGARADGTAWAPAGGDDVVGPLWERTADFLRPAWARVDRDIRAELDEGKILTPLQREVILQWLVLGTHVRRAEREGGPRTEWHGFGPPARNEWSGFGPSDTLHQPPAALEAMWAAIAAAILQSPLINVVDEERHQFSARTPDSYEAVMSILNGLVSQSSHLVRDSLRAVQIAPMIAGLLQGAEQGAPQGGLGLLRHVLRQELRRAVDAAHLNPLEMNLVNEAFLVEVERLPLATRAAWEDEGVTETEGLLRAMASVREKGSGQEQANAPRDGEEDASWADTANDQPVLWRICQRVAGKDPERDPLPSSLDTGNWVWRWHGQGAELDVNLMALAADLRRADRTDDDQELALNNLLELTPAQIASCSVRAIRPFLSSSYQPVRTWAIQTISLVRGPAEERSDGPQALGRTP